MLGKVLKGIAIALPIVTLLAAGPLLAPRMGAGTLEETASTVGRQVSFIFVNDTGVEADGLQVEFRNAPGNVFKNLVSITPFKSAVPVMKSNVIQLSGARVSANEKVTLTLRADEVGLAVKDFQWVRQGVLIGGKSREVAVREQVVTLDNVSLDQMQKDENVTLVPVSFEVSSQGGQLFITKGMNIFQNAVLAVKDQAKLDQLMGDLMRLDAKKVKERQKVEAEISKLQVKSPLSGVVKEMSFEIGDETLKIQLQVQPMVASMPSGLPR